MPAKNPCLDLIVEYIRQNGFITTARFIHECLIGEHGYYRADRDPLGTHGDFITAPEISQLFGEIIGLWGIEAWQKEWQGHNLRLCEFGPGRGTLMQDAVRAIAQAAKTVPDDIFLLEANPNLRQQQAKKLASCNTNWIDDLSQLPDQPLLFIANEFFDTLPTDQIILGDRWMTRGLKLDPADKLVWDCHGDAGIAAIQKFMPKTAARRGDVFEYSAASHAIFRNMAAHLQRHGGMAIIIDYGHTEPGYGDTIQALLKHQKVDARDHPGLADMTTHVDFNALSLIAGECGLRTRFLGTQGAFLKSYGIELRLSQLMKSATPEQQQTLRQGADRLTLPDQMGRLFKVLIVSR